MDNKTEYYLNSLHTGPEINELVLNKQEAGLHDLNNQLYELVILVSEKKAGTEDINKISFLIKSIESELNKTEVINIDQSDSYYFLGIYSVLTGNSLSSITSFKKSIEIREKLNVYDLRLGRAAYNMGFAYRELGDSYSTVECQLKVIEVYNKLFGKESKELVDPYFSLSAAYIETQQHQKAASCLNAALLIAESKPDSLPVETIADLYTNLGISYSRFSDFSKAQIYFEKSLSEYDVKHIDINNSVTYINLINCLANNYNSLRLPDKSSEYYEKGVKLALAMHENSLYNLNLVNSYAIILGNNGNSKKGEELLSLILKKAEVDSVARSQLYYEVLYNYAEYLREYNIDIKKSLDNFSKCMSYLEKNPDDHLLKSKIYAGYALSLSVSGKPLEAIDVIQKLLSSLYIIDTSKTEYNNPEIESIRSDRISLRLFSFKYKILSSLFKEQKKVKYLEAAALTSEVVVALLEKMRINISQEDSRLLLGDLYRDAYFASIGDYQLLYRYSSEKKYLEKAFEYSEKSKVAGLLTSTREMKATQFQIPGEIAEYEFRLKNEIGLLYARIDEETFKDKPNADLIGIMNENLLKNTRLRDSLIQVFERDYPGYYTMKYNTNVVAMDDIHHIIGRNVNYINYLLSDTILYIFVANRKNKELISTKVSTDLLDKIRKFRSLLSMPGPEDDALSSFKEFRSAGTELYKILVEPFIPFLISDQLIISPDNILSYIPFETLPSGEYSDLKPLYSTIPYMMNKFDISYTYSVTFMAESVRTGIRLRNKVLAFAPEYPDKIDVQSVLMSRQGQEEILQDLPFARQEAKFVTDMTGGKLYENAEARESTFKKEAGKYDILHLAMHTLLNDKEPMYSTLIFSPEPDTTEDRYLKTYEVYGIPLKAKMVVLSSCNTGSGLLFSGEGILSLARGFIYSGSQSVVMSMWEIEDRSGIDIVKMFYENLKKGNTKSTSLRKARLEYLKTSDQLRAHPYFWSALIVYGNNDPLYYSKYSILTVIIISIVILLTAGIYIRRRRYS
jgi:CHAT domain-containing protein